MVILTSGGVSTHTKTTSKYSITSESPAFKNTPEEVKEKLKEVKRPSEGSEDPINLRGHDN